MDESVSTTEFWTSENERDLAQLMTKRITFTVYLWLFRVMMMLVVMILLSVMLTVPVAVALSILNNYIRRVTAKKRNYWANREMLLETLYNRIDTAAEKVADKQSKADEKLMAKARDDYNKLVYGGKDPPQTPKPPEIKPVAKEDEPKASEPPPAEPATPPPPPPPPRPQLRPPFRPRGPRPPMVRGPRPGTIQPRFGRPTRPLRPYGQR